MSTTFELTTVIVNWNTVDLLADCIDSVTDNVPAHVSQQIVVVDNASTDGSVDWLREHRPEVLVIESPENVGFCRGNNLALRTTDSELVLLINTDARLTPDSFTAMLAHLERDPRAAIIGPRLVFGDGGFQRWTGGRPITLRSMAMFLFGLDRFDRNVPAFGGIYLGHDATTAFRAGWVSSAVMLIRRSALDEIGLLDDTIFVYMDDVDLCQRATAAGWNVWYAADATAIHFMGASTRRVTGKASPEALRALNRWFVKQHGSTRGSLLRGLEAVGFGARVLAYRARALAGDGAGARLQATAHLTHLKIALERPHEH